jgi:Tfp pilus assembly protein PilF
MYRQAVAIKEKVLGPRHPELATTLNNLAVLQGKQGKQQHAKQTFRRALAIFEKTLGRAHPSFKACYANYKSLLGNGKNTRRVQAEN